MSQHYNAYITIIVMTLAGCADPAELVVQSCATNGSPSDGDCHDAICNGDETDTDCGGSCNPCKNAKSCSKDEDCFSHFCHTTPTGSVCTDYKTVPPCSNGHLDESETDVDCGGLCDPCATGRSCNQSTDCQSHICVPTMVHTFGAIGQCWGAEFSGCAVVNDAKFAEQMCGQKTLAICQYALNSQMKTHCVKSTINVTQWDVNFLCCDPAMF